LANENETVESNTVDLVLDSRDQLGSQKCLSRRLEIKGAAVFFR
jgi:hypothetical protein